MGAILLDPVIEATGIDLAQFIQVRLPAANVVGVSLGDAPGLVVNKGAAESSRVLADKAFALDEPVPKKLLPLFEKLKTATDMSPDGPDYYLTWWPDDRESRRFFEKLVGSQQVGAPRTVLATSSDKRNIADLGADFEGIVVDAKTRDALLACLPDQGVGAQVPWLVTLRDQIIQLVLATEAGIAERKKWSFGSRNERA